MELTSDYIVAWLYEPGMPMALAIAYSSELPIYGRPQIIATTPHEYWSGISNRERQQICRDYLIEEANET